MVQSFIVKQIKLRAILTCLAAVAVAWILIDATWGACAGIIIGRNLNNNQEIVNFLKAKGIETNDRKQIDRAVRQLPSQDQTELQGIVIKETLVTTNIFVLTVFTSIIAYGIMGFLGGLVAQEWFLIGLLPLYTIFTNNPIVRFTLTQHLSVPQQFAVFLIQLVACMGFAFWGSAIIKKRLDKKRMSS